MVQINALIGNFGRYQLWICFIIFMSKFGIAFHHMAIIFLAPPVKYSCPGNATCCNDPVYDTSRFKKTIVTEWNLICGRSWLKDINQTFFQLGVLVGSFLFGIASDRYGRRPTLIVAVILEVFIGIMSSFIPDYWTFTIFRMLLGFAVGGVMVIGFVVVMEYVGNKNRDVISALYQVPFNLGHILVAVFGYYITDYSYFQLAISVVNAILLFYICALPETPRWLLAVNKTAKAVSLIEGVAKINKLPTEEIHDKVVLFQMEHHVHGQKGTFLDLFRAPHMRRNIIIMSLNWLVCSYCFYGVSQYISHLTGDIFINVIAEGFVGLCGTIISIPIMKCMGRKTAVIICNVACSVSLILISFVPQGVASTILGCIGVLFSFIVFVVSYLYCSEMFPTVVRNAALGISSMMARVGAMIAPFVAALRPTGKWVAPVCFGIFPLITAALCIFLPETKDCELIATLEEGEEIGSSNLQGTDETIL